MFYLALNGERDAVMPIPKIFYKAIVDRKYNKGVALVMTNDPFVTQKEIKKYVYCQDVSKKVKWVRKMKPRVK